jgi:hypothetical protein
MWKQPENDAFAEQLYLPNEQAPPGVYKEVGGRRRVCLEFRGYLPAGRNGKVSCYRRVFPTKSTIERLLIRAADHWRRRLSHGTGTGHPQRV